MSDFKNFRALLQDHFNEMVKGENPLFITDADEDELYNLYLDRDTDCTVRLRLHR